MEKCKTKSFPDEAHTQKVVGNIQETLSPIWLD